MAATIIMVQGTTSDAGKTVLVAGICRVLARKGLRVAPFKPQNMALNSAVTPCGGEIGRAQALQALACGIDAHTDMNPILLKPSSDTGAQVVVHGKAISAMEAAAYHDYKQVAMEAVLSSIERLKQQYDYIIVEGAGSPAEINLRENDIANMGFAEAVDCPVIIVADIDKGGVFAHLVGTLDLLSKSEQDRVKGFVINRFRGDIGLLEPGLDWLEARTAKAVIGVLPYLQGLFLDAEDAINISQQLDTTREYLKVVVPVFARISNHTDFDVLRLHPQVDLVFVGQNAPVPACDLIILPGSKNVRSDVQWLRDNDWPQAINKHLRYRGRLLGICGGYQMLGQSINDPGGIEDIPGSAKGLCLLDFETELAPAKHLQHSEGTLLLNDTAVAVKGYEIHCGLSSGPALNKPLVQLNNGCLDGVISPDGMILGSYLHGLFDTPASCQQLLVWAGLSLTDAPDINRIRETQLNRLADAIEQSLNLKALGLPV